MSTRSLVYKLSHNFKLHVYGFFYLDPYRTFFFERRKTSAFIESNSNRYITGKTSVSKIDHKPRPITENLKSYEAPRSTLGNPAFSDLLTEGLLQKTHFIWLETQPAHDLPIDRLRTFPVSVLQQNAPLLQV